MRPRSIPGFFMALALSAAVMAQPGHAERSGGLPPGVAEAELLPLATAPDGGVVTALRVLLEPGWKTYWRSPGDTGMPPEFDWGASINVAGAEPLWPAPEVIQSGGDRTLGYHDEMLLPVRIRPALPDQPIVLDVTVDLGLCETVCVPGHLRLSLPPAEVAAQPDPRIEAAIARVPVLSPDRPACEVAPVADGVRLVATLPAGANGAGTGNTGAGTMPAVAMELGDGGVWVSQPEIGEVAGRLTATADFVPPEAQPFDLPQDQLRLTVIPGGAGEGGHGLTGTATGGQAGAVPAAVEYQGCSGS